MPAPRPAVLLLVACAVLLSMLLAGGLWAFDPATSGMFPPCPVLWATGLQCPGCGTLRAVHALLHFDVVAALALNPLAVIAAPLVVSWLVVEGLSALGFGVRTPSVGPRTAWTVVLVLVMFGVARNLVA